MELDKNFVKLDSILVGKSLNNLENKVRYTIVSEFLIKEK